MSSEHYDDSDADIQTPVVAHNNKIASSLKGKYHWMLTLLIILAVAPSVFIISLLLESAPCNAGLCWYQLTWGQLALLAMIIVSVGVHALQVLSDISNRYRDTVFSKGENPMVLLSTTVVPNGIRKHSESPTFENGKLGKNCVGDCCVHLSRLGLILILFFICDKTSLLTHVDKHYDRDSFFFLCFLLLIAGVATIRKSHGKDEILNRELTEEWKGWMQIVFLMYHYFDAQEFYAPIRIFVSCYVWMTGFGNFSFFYMKGDFSWYRAVSMLWRLNFVAFFLVLSMDTWYQLYYIVQLHTFYFLMVYICMGIKSTGNHSPYTLQAKLAILFALVYLIWDVPGVFDTVFGFFPPKLLHDWHFRTYLDHYSAPLGMLFAFCFPMLRSWFATVEKMRPVRQWTIKITVGIFLLAAVFLTMGTVNIFSKADYNARHPYQVLFAILAFVYWRNISPTIRQYSMGIFCYVGKITLESYLAQFHLLLVMDAKGGYCKQILSIFPGYPLVNAAVVTCVFFWVSGQLLDITNRLRSLLIPDDPLTRERLFPRRLAATVAAALALAAYAKCAQILQLSPAPFVTLLVPIIFAIAYFNFDASASASARPADPDAACSAGTPLIAANGTAATVLGDEEGAGGACGNPPPGRGARLPSVRDALPWAAVGLVLLLPLLFQLPPMPDGVPASWAASARSLTAGGMAPAPAGSNRTLPGGAAAGAMAKGFVGCDWALGLGLLAVVAVSLFTGDGMIVSKSVLQLAGGEAPDIQSSYRRQEAS